MQVLYGVSLGFTIAALLHAKLLIFTEPWGGLVLISFVVVGYFATVAGVILSLWDLFKKEKERWIKVVSPAAIGFCGMIAIDNLGKVKLGIVHSIVTVVAVALMILIVWGAARVWHEK